MDPLSSVAARASSCTACGLCQSRSRVVFGVGDPAADVMFVGEAPGAREDAEGVPFVGRSGQLLDRLMAEEMGLSRERGVYIANTVKCRPPDNRDPRPDELAACRPFLWAQIDLVAPRVVVTVGRFAAQELLQTTAGINELRGSVYPFRSGVLVPTFHPAAVLRGGATMMAKMRADLVRAKLEIERVAAGGGS